MCDEIFSKLACMASKDADLQCYPLLFLSYLLFCAFIAIFTFCIDITNSYDGTILGDIAFYLIAMSIIWELLFNYYRYYTTLHCVLTLSNTEENCQLYALILLKFSIYAILFMTCFVLSFILPLHTTLYLRIVWWCLAAFMVLIHCVSNSYFIIRFSHILSAQYDTMRQMNPNLEDIINDSVMAVVSMKRYSLCSIAISTLYLLALLLCNQYVNEYLIIILRYYPLCWCLLCFAFCLNFGKNREWIKERILSLKLAVKTRYRIHKHASTKQHINIQNSINEHKEPKSKTNAESDPHQMNAVSEDDTSASLSTASLTTSGTTPPPHRKTGLVSKVPKIRKSRSSSEYKTLRSKRHHYEMNIDGMPRSSTDRSASEGNHFKRNVPFSIIIKQHKALCERETLLEQNETFTPSTVRGTKLYASRSAIEQPKPMTSTHSTEDLYKSYSFTEQHRKQSAQSNESISDTPNTFLRVDQMPEHIARAQTLDVNHLERAEDHDKALQALKMSFNSSKSRSDDNLHRYTERMRQGIRSENAFRKTRTKRNVCKALALLGITTTTTTTEQTGSRSESSSEYLSMDNDDGHELDDTDTIVWMGEEDESNTTERKRVFFSNVADAEDMTIDIEMDEMSEDMSAGDGKQENELCLKHKVRKGQLTPLQSLEMLQRNSINSRNAPKMPRAASYDLGTMDHNMSQELHHSTMRSVSDIRQSTQLKKELHAINELNEEITQRQRNDDEDVSYPMDDAVNLMYLMVKQGLYTSKNFNSLKQISKYNYNQR